MSKAFMNKYRPNTLDEFICKQSMKDSILGSLKTVHFYLFHGVRGCGKTTMARIVANQLVDDEWDIHEINAADKTKVDDARDLIMKMALAPQFGNRKVYIIDECHRFTSNAQDSLLKVLEEPPDHVYWIFCTTEVSKLALTIRSRAKAGEFLFSPMTRRDLFSLLEYVMDKEGLEINASVLRAVVKNSGGIPREALNILERIKDVGDVNEAIILADEKGTENVELRDLIKHMLSKQFPTNSGWNKSAEFISRLSDMEPEQIRRGILGYMNKVALGSDKPPGWIVLMMEQFESNWYDSGISGLTAAVFRAWEAAVGD